MIIRSTLRSIRRHSPTKLPMRHMSVINLSDKDALEKFTKMNEKSVLYFTASWCPPCKMISPIYEKMSETHSDVAFGKVDVDNNSDSAMDFKAKKISAVPTFILLKDEKIHERFSGADDKQLGNLIENLKQS